MLRGDPVLIQKKNFGGDPVLIHRKISSLNEFIKDSADPPADPKKILSADPPADPEANFKGGSVDQ